MIFSREISNFLLLFGLVALVQVPDANGEIDIDEIDRQLNNPCVPNARRRREDERGWILDELNSTSKVVFLEFKAENPGYCRFADKYTDLADIGIKEELPVRTSSSQLCDDLRFYYAWMLWIKEAKQFMDMVDVPSFSVTQFNEMVNYLRQAVCLCPLSTSTPLFPDSTSSTDPVDYLEPTCYVLEKFSQFSTRAYACTRKGRKGDSRQKTDQPDKPASVESPPSGTAGGKSENRKDGNKQKGGKSVNRKDGNKQKGQDRKKNRRTRNRTDNAKRLPEESNPGNDIRRGGGQKRKDHDRKCHGRKKSGRKKNKPARISTPGVKNPIETTESKQIIKSDNTPPCVTKPETTKPERRQRKKDKGKRRNGKGGKRRGKKNRGGKRGKRNRKNRRRNKQRKNKNKKRDRRNKGKKDSKKVGRRHFPERKRKETKSILDFFFF